MKLTDFLFTKRHLEFPVLAFSGRFFSILFFMVAAIVVNHLILMSIHCLLACLLLRLYTGSWFILTQSWRMLRWFVFPMIALHLIFTPGELLFNYGPSKEGIHTAMWYSLHLSIMFLSGLLMASALSFKEWRAICSHSPFVGKKLHAFLSLMWPMYLDFKPRISLYYQQWQLKKLWRQFPSLLFAVMVHALQQGQVQAQHVWLCWDGVVELPNTRLDRYAVACSFLSLLWCVLLWIN